MRPRRKMRNLPCFVWLFVIAFVAMPLYGQDDSSTPPPQTESTMPPAPDQGAAPAPDDNAPPPDDANAAPDPGVSFQTFYDALGNQGTWIQSNDYGYVWQPTVTDPNWAPYTQGHWVYSNDGWTWVSDESFGWATYHYGRWVNLDGTGWCWVPGYTWAPAWVAWRYGNGYAGWAPLPPDSFVGVDYSDDNTSLDVGFHIGGDCDAFYGIGAGWYTFLPVNCLGYPNYHGYYRNRGDNFAIINHTTNVTNLNVTRGGGGGHFHRVTTGGPMLAEVNAASSSPVQRVNLVRTSQPGGGGTLNGNSLSLFAPRVNSGGTSQPQRVAGSIGKPAINRGADVLRPLAVNSQLGGSPATEAQVQQARMATDHSPASAKVMTDETTVRPVLQAPLASMHPAGREVSQERTVTTPPDEFANPQHEPSVIMPQQRIYPQTAEPGSVPSRSYYPNATSGSPYDQPHSAVVPGTIPHTQTFVRPATPAVTPGTPVVHQAQQPSAPPQQTTSQNQGQSSNGGYSGGGNRGASGGGGGYNNGGGSGNSRSGGNSSQTH